MLVRLSKNHLTNLSFDRIPEVPVKLGKLSESTHYPVFTYASVDTVAHYCMIEKYES